MVQDITRKCLWDLVQDWQTESDLPGPNRRLENVTEETDESIQSASSCRFQKPSHNDDFSHLSILPQQSEAFDFGYNFFMDDPSLFGTENMFVNTTDNFSTELGEQGANAEASKFQAETELINNSFFCLKIPPHPEPQLYTGKGKSHELLPTSSDNTICSRCFPDSGYMDTYGEA